MIIEKVCITSPAGFRWQWHPEEIADYYPIDGPKVEHFVTGMSEAGLGYEDELICPCDAVLPRGRTLGDDMAFAREHLAKAHAP